MEAMMSFADYTEHVSGQKMALQTIQSMFRGKKMAL